MQSEATTADEQPPAEPGPVVPRRRSERREKTLQAALRKRAAGVPTYTVRYVVPARAVEAMLDAATQTGILVAAAAYCPTGSVA